MFLENVSVQILDVLLFRQRKAKYHTRRRNFSALSFRIVSEGQYLYRSKKLNAASGDISFVPAGVSYDRVTEDEEVLVVHFDMLNHAEDEIRVFTPADPALYRELFSRLLAVWEKKEAGYRCEAAAVFYEILYRMQREGLGEEVQRDGYVTESARYMQQNLGDASLSIASLARRACVSEALLRRMFRRSYGVSPKEYLENLRMQYAASLLNAGYFTQTEIARRCGYADVKYFRTAFKRRMGMTLTEYTYQFPAAVLIEEEKPRESQK